MLRIDVLYAKRSLTMNLKACLIPIKRIHSQQIVAGRTS